MGSIVANYASSEGHNVVIIDKNEKAFELLSPEFSGFTVHGDATEVENLKAAKIEKADVFLALTNNDNVNFMVSMIAKRVFGVRKVIARVYDPDNFELFQEFDINAISPILLMSEALKGVLISPME
ncbi:MAG: TrkA family potassium uptake protein [Thermotogaceae bacterium]|nr:TrkA family potassium uptake protein [Thermotogaceae bacterium]